MRLRPRTHQETRLVLLDASFIDALIAADSPHHGAARELYATLVQRYESGLDRLFALADVLRDLPREFRRNALAPVTTLRVAGQHRSAADRISDRSPQAALSLVMMRRERIRAVATTTHDFDDVHVEVLGVENDLDLDAEAAALSSETAPRPARQSTDG